MLRESESDGVNETYEEMDFPIAGPDPLMPLFKADAAGLGDAFTEEALKRRGVAPVKAPPPAIPAKRDRGGRDL
jgi:hypothetical protein